MFLRYKCMSQVRLFRTATTKTPVDRRTVIFGRNLAVITRVMSSALRNEVIACFRNLHKAAKFTFKDDDYAIQKAREKINSEFRKNINEEDPEKIKELIKFGNEAATLVRTTVIQGRLNSDGSYLLRVHEETQKIDNIPFTVGPGQVKQK